MLDYSHYIYKVVLIGDPGVGKTNISSRFINNKFDFEYKHTIGCHSNTRSMNFNDKRIEVVVWDIAGQKRYRSKICPIFKGVQGALIFYDITRKITFENVEGWLKELRDQANQNIVIMLVGNKADLDHLRSVQTEDAKSFAERENILFMEISALESLNVENAFTKVLTEIYHVKNNKLLDIGNDPMAIPIPQTFNVQEFSCLDYLKSDMNFGRKKILKEGTSKEVKGEHKAKSLMVDDAIYENLGSKTEIKRVGSTIVINVEVDDIENILSSGKEFTNEKLKLDKNYQALKDIHLKTIDELSALKDELSALKDELSAIREDRVMLISKVIPHVVSKLRRSHEYCSALARLLGFAIRLGRQQSLEAFREACPEDLKKELENHDPTASDRFKGACKGFEEMQFPFINEVSSDIHRSAKDIMNIKST